MVGFDEGDTLAERFRAHARDSTDLYAYATRGMADDWEAGGPVATLLRGYDDAPSGSMLQLRLLAGVFRLVLSGQAPELVRFYPCLGGDAPSAQAWPVMREVMATHVEVLRASLLVAPQTNEVGRSAALLVGLCDVVAAAGVDRVRLLEVGASAGLNLLLDRFWFGSGPDEAVREAWSWGDPDSPVRFGGAIRGPFTPVPFTVVDRRGCDLHPVDATTADGRVLLTSFVWPFVLERHRRLAATLLVAEAHPVRVEPASAASWLGEVLAQPSDPGTLDVIWHSITQMYWPPAEIAAMNQVLAAAGDRAPLAQVGLEYAPDARPTEKPELRTTLWGGDGTPPQRRLLGTAHDHGVPVRLASTRR